MTREELTNAKWAIRVPKTIKEVKSLINCYKRLRKINTYVNGTPVRNSVVTAIILTIRKYDYSRAIRDRALLSDSVLKLEDYLNKF